MRSTAYSLFRGRPAKRLTFLISVRDQVRRASLEIELLRRARKAKLAGCTVFEGEQGFGASGHLHEVHLMADDRPLAVIFIDQPERIVAFLDEVTPLLHDVVVAVDEIEILDL